MGVPARQPAFSSSRDVIRTSGLRTDIARALSAREVPLRMGKRCVDSAPCPAVRPRSPRRSRSAQPRRLRRTRSRRRATPASTSTWRSCRAPKARRLRERSGTRCRPRCSASSRARAPRVAGSRRSSTRPRPLDRRRRSPRGRTQGRRPAVKHAAPTARRPCRAATPRWPPSARRSATVRVRAEWGRPAAAADREHHRARGRSRCGVVVAHEDVASGGLRGPRLATGRRAPPPRPNPCASVSSTAALSFRQDPALRAPWLNRMVGVGRTASASPSTGADRDARSAARRGRGGPRLARLSLGVARRRGRRRRGPRTDADRAHHSGAPIGPRTRRPAGARPAPGARTPPPWAPSPVPPRCATPRPLLAGLERAEPQHLPHPAVASTASPPRPLTTAGCSTRSTTR